MESGNYEITVREQEVEEAASQWLDHRNLEDHQFLYIMTIFVYKIMAILCFGYSST